MNRVTTSEKIRTLARAGLTRKAIADQLGISYQHVRKVMIDAGMTGGLSHGKHPEHVTVSGKSAQRHPSFPSQALLDAGFRLIGEWNQGAGNRITLNSPWLKSDCCEVRSGMKSV